MVATAKSKTQVEYEEKHGEKHRIEFDALTEPGKHLEEVAMAAAWNGSTYSTAEYITLRTTATLKELVSAILVRKAMEFD